MNKKTSEAWLYNKRITSLANFYIEIKHVVKYYRRICNYVDLEVNPSCSVIDASLFSEKLINWQFDWQFHLFVFLYFIAPKPEPYVFHSVSSFTGLFSVDLCRSSRRRSSTKKVFLSILQNSKESSCARVSFLTKFQTEDCAFLWILRNLSEHFFCRTSVRDPCGLVDQSKFLRNILLNSACQPSFNIALYQKQGILRKSCFENFGKLLLNRLWQSSLFRLC